MVRFILLQEGKIPEETIDKLQKCENLEEYRTVPFGVPKGVESGRAGAGSKTLFNPGGYRLYSAEFKPRRYLLR